VSKKQKIEVQPTMKLKKTLVLRTEKTLQSISLFLLIAFICSLFFPNSFSVLTQSHRVLSESVGNWNEGFRFSWAVPSSFHNFTLSAHNVEVNYLSPALMQAAKLIQSMFSQVSTVSFLSDALLFQNHSQLYFESKLFRILFLALTFLPLLLHFQLSNWLLLPWFVVGTATGDYQFTSVALLIGVALHSNLQAFGNVFLFCTGFVALHFSFLFEITLCVLFLMAFCIAKRSANKLLAFSLGLFLSSGILWILPSENNVWGKYLNFHSKVFFENWLARNRGAGLWEQYYAFTPMILLVPYLLQSLLFPPRHNARGTA
jgi:hypothetical protein